MQLNPLTFVFEIVNFLVLLFVLERWVFRPLRRGITARREEEARAKEEAQEKLARAESIERELADERRAIADVRDRALREAAEQATEERARILAQAREDAAAERARASRLVEAEREAAEAWVQEVAVERGTEIAGRMLLALAPGAAEAALRARLLEEIARRGVELSPASTDGSVEVELRSAALGESRDVESIRDALARAMGRPVRLVVREDEKLLAGVVLRVGDRVLDASVAGQLEAFRDRARAMLQEDRGD